jgi:hypothetical protein
MPKFISDDEMTKIEEAERPKKRILSDEELSAMEQAEKEGVLPASLNKFAQGASFGLTDELAGGLEAVGSKLGMRGLGGQITDIRRESPEEDKQSFADVYRQRRDQNRLRQEAETRAFPRTAMGSELAGAVTSGMLTGNPASLAGKVGLGAGEAALQGFGSSEADTLGGLARDTAVAGSLGGATSGTLGGLGRLSDRSGLTGLARRAIVDPVADAARSLKDKATSVANERAVKAVFGQNKKAFDELKKLNRTQEAGADLLARDEAGAPIVGWTTKSETALPALLAKKKYFGEEIGNVGQTVDRILPEGGIQGTDISESALDYASKNIPETSLFDPQREKLMRLAEDYQGRNIPWSEAQQLKSALRYNPLDSSTRDLGKEATNALNRSASGAMDKAVERARGVEGVSPEDARLLELYPYLKGKYQTFRQGSAAAKDRATANLSNRFVSPSDMFVGGVLGGASMINNPENAVGSGSLALGGALANKAFRGRGSAFSANAAKSVADFIESGSAQAQKYGPYLQKVLQEQGPQNAALALYLLLKNDPQTRGSMITEGNPR